MMRKILVVLAIVFITMSSSYVDHKLTDEDIEETSQLIVNFLEPLLELRGLTMNDFPNQLKYLISKYYLIFSRQVEPLHILEKMISDYNVVINNLRLEDEALQKQIADFIEGNDLKKKKLLDNFVTEILDEFDFELQVVDPRDALKFLLFQEAYPDLMELVSSMVQKHHEAYVNERAKQAGKVNPRPGSPKKLNDNDNDDDYEDDDFDLTTSIRAFVATHGRLELIKRMLEYLDQFMPPVDHKDISESTLDYLDDLQDYLVGISDFLWDYLKGSSYTHTTDKWIKSSEDMLRDILTICPFQEILNFIDVVVSNPNDKRAAIRLRYQHALRRNDNRNSDNQNPMSVTNARGVFDYILEALDNGFKSVHEILRSTVMGENKEVSEENFLKFIDDELAPHDMTSKDLSKDMLAIFSRIFKRIQSLKDSSLSEDDKKTLEQDIQYFRQNLEKIRDAFRLLVPEKDEASHVIMESLLQTQVNKYGPLVKVMEKTLVSYFNIRFETPDKLDDKMVEEDTAHFVQKLDMVLSMVEKSGKKPSDLLKQRLSEIVAFIDGFVMFARL